MQDDSSRITQGDPLFDKILRAWGSQGKPSRVTVGGVEYMDAGENSWVAVRRVENGGMGGDYGSNSMPGTGDRATNGDGTPMNFRPHY